MNQLTKPKYYELKMWLYENNIIGIILEKHGNTTLVKLMSDSGTSLLADPRELKQIILPHESPHAVNDKRIYLIDYVTRLKKSLEPEIIKWRNLVDTEEREKDELRRLLEKYGKS